MNFTEFKEYAIAADYEAHHHFSRYKLKVALFALLGYLVLFVTLLLLIGLVGGLLASAFFSTAILIFLVKKKLIFIILPLIWMLIKALFIRIPAPQGYIITRQQCPALFHEIDTLCNTLKTVKVHQVLLTPEFNAAVVQTPRLGILGWQKNTLFLGLELLLSLSPEQAKAVLAHELGHLSGNHSRFNNWIYRLRMAWQTVLETLQTQQSWGAGVMGRFFNWYSPRFSAYSFPLARQNEYEADAISARLTSANTISQALVNTSVKGSILDELYWQPFFKQADQFPEPQQLPWAQLKDFNQFDSDALDQALANALKHATDFDDTHPSLTDRLKALEGEASLPELHSSSAAEVWLGRYLDSVLVDFDQNWHVGIKEQWQQRYEYVQQSQRELSALQKPSLTELSQEQIWQLACLQEEFVDSNTALITYRLYSQQDPEHLDARLAIGRILASQNDSDCIQEFERCSNTLPYSLEATELAYYFFKNKGETQLAEQWLEKYELADTQQQQSVAERDLLNVEDKLCRCDIETEAVQALLAELKATKNIKHAWIACKKTQYYRDIPAYAVAVKVGGMAWPADRLQIKLTEQFAEHHCWIIPQAGDFKPLAKHIIKQGQQLF